MDKKSVIKIVKISIIIILLAVIAFCAYKIIALELEYRQGEDTFSDLANQVIKTEEKPQSPTSSEASEEQGSSDIAPNVHVDFETLKEINSDVVGWIMLEDTVLNYPIVQGKDNVYYLKHMINYKYNNCGTIFLDARNEKDFSSPHSFIYGHNMRNGTMFACITGYSRQSFYEEHKELTLFLPDKTYKLLPYSAYPTNGSDLKTYDFKGSTDGKEYFDFTKGKSQFKSDVEYEEGDRILTLSTCEYHRYDGRYVLHCIIKEVN